MAKSTALFVGRQSLGGENASKIADFDDAFASLVGCNVASFGVFPLLGFASNLRSVLTPNDENAAPIIHYLQTKGVKAKTFPVTGQDATTVGLQNILAGT